MPETPEAGPGTAPGAPGHQPGEHPVDLELGDPPMTQAEREQAISQQQAAAQSAPPLPVKPPADVYPAIFRVRRGEDGSYYWTILGPDWQPLATSEPYPTLEGVQNAVAKVRGPDDQLLLDAQYAPYTVMQPKKTR